MNQLNVQVILSVSDILQRLEKDVRETRSKSDSQA